MTPEFLYRARRYWFGGDWRIWYERCTVTAGEYTDRQKADRDSINAQIDKLDKVLGISKDAAQ